MFFLGFYLSGGYYDIDYSSKPSIVCIGKTEPFQIEDVALFHQRQQFSVHVDIVNIPNPDKILTGGEDAYFISSDRYTFGIFDGVGGWNDRVGLY